jgi:H+/Cl- antiporter ClcA
MKGDPNFRDNLLAELRNSRLWLDRLVVASFALAAGLAVVLFTLLADWASEAFLDLQDAWRWAPLIWTPALSGLIVWLLRSWLKGAGGSGPPQIIAAIDPHADDAMRGKLASLRISAAKIVAVTGGILAGLSMGRQGPSVQIAAGIMYSARRFLSAKSGIKPRELLIAGGAAGIAAAFNTPLGGIVFAVEELNRKVEQRSSGLMLAGIVLAGLVAISVFGNLSYFGRIRVESVGWSVLPPTVLVTVLCGLGGGLLARLLITSAAGVPSRVCAFQRKYPIRFAMLCGLAVGVINVVTQSSVSGGGHEHTRVLLNSGEPGMPVLWTWLKFVATWLSAWSGVPGGLFAPSLSLGASIGGDVAYFIAPEYHVVLIALGMAAFLGAVTQAPITAMIIVMEMVDGYDLVLGLMACAMAASLVSRMVSRPLFATMADITLARLAAQSPPASDQAHQDHAVSPPPRSGDNEK